MGGRFPGIYMPHPAARLLHNTALILVNTLLIVRSRHDRLEVDTWGNLTVRKPNGSEEVQEILSAFDEAAR
jgi:hypothetical protein